MAGHLPTERAILEIVDAEFEHLNDMMEKIDAAKRSNTEEPEETLGDGDDTA